ncbi:hypothetical protein Z950_3029 [Sulfitobacter mediterraneus KCTC 32188]|nr:hypothetical protein Z950_3029 [Sulfitobacter mediterraneus KCTC 32188]
MGGMVPGGAAIARADQNHGASVWICPLAFAALALIRSA